MVLVLSESLGVQTTAVSATMLAEQRVDAPQVRREVLGTSLAGMMAALVVAAPLPLPPLPRGPHLASAPLVLAISDNITLLTYFTLVTHLVV
jgi:magnesium transporter